MKAIPKIFQNRQAAGKALAETLRSYYQQADTWVLGLPRGGVEVGAEVARMLELPLDVLAVCKLAVRQDGQERLIGAIALDGTVWIDEAKAHAYGLSQAAIEQRVLHTRKQMQYCHRYYNQEQTLQRWTGKTLLVIDDGISYSPVIQMAVQVLRKAQAGRIIVAAPVAAAEVLVELQGEADHLVVLEAPTHFGAIENWYREYPQLLDSQVEAWLESRRQ
jgi:putative phosphoribosyl transferase